MIVLAIFHSAQELAAHQKRRGEKIQKSLQIAHEQFVGEVKAEANRLVSGGIKTANLREFGHPYARRHGKRNTRVVLTPLLPVNVQTGQLRRSLRVFRRTVGKSTVWQLQFTSPHVIVTRPGGTATMKDRGFWKEMNALAKNAHKFRFVAAWRAAKR